MSKQFAMNLDHPLSVGCTMGGVEDVTSPSRGFTMTKAQWQAIKELVGSSKWLKAQWNGNPEVNHPWVQQVINRLTASIELVEETFGLDKNE